MVPRPEPPAVETVVSSSSAGDMSSPTGVTNSFPRSRSPAKRFGRTPSEEMENWVPSRKPSNGRRRTLEETRTAAPQNDPPVKEILPQQKSEPRVVGELLSFNHNVLSCSGSAGEPSAEQAKQQKPTTQAVQKLGSLMGAAGDGFTNFAIAAAEVYRQECKSGNRGGDEDFFKQHVPSKQTDVDTMDDEFDNSVAADNSEDGPGPIKTGASPRLSKMDQQRPTRIPTFSQTTRSSRGTRFPDISPPRAVRTSSVREFQPRAESGDLMEARMELFRLGQESVPQSEIRLSRALQDLKRQDKAIDGWKRQLQTMQEQLDTTVAELEKTKSDSQEKQLKATEIRAKAVQDRKKMKDLYDRELDENKKLKATVAKLQAEVSSLKISLRNARNSTGGTKQTNSKGEVANSGLVIALRAEIVDLKSQLAEAHASNIDDTSSLHASPETEDLRRRLAVLQDELQELRDKDLDIRRLEKEHREATKRLREKLESAETEAKQAKSKLEESLQTADREESQVRAELVKVKANLQRLEREKTRMRLNSAADVDRLNAQLAASTTENTKLKETLTQGQEKAKEEASKLRKEIIALKHELSQVKHGSSKDVKFQEERRQLEDKLNDLREEVNDLRKQLNDKAEVISSQAKRIAGFESETAKGTSLTKPIADARKISLLEEEIKFRKASETALRADLKLHKSLLAQERAETAMKEEENERKVRGSTGTSLLDDLRKKLEFFKGEDAQKGSQRMETSELQDGIAELEKNVSLAMGTNKLQIDSTLAETYKQEISTLRAKLQEVETLCREEKSRAEEERRISKENERLHAETVEELQQENERTSQEKTRLRKELEELRKQMASLMSPGRGEANSSNKDQISEPAKNVNRLRNELALARARLAAARDQSRVSKPSSISSVEVEEDANTMEEVTVHTESPVDSSGNSVCSYESCWAPPETDVRGVPRVVTPVQQHYDIPRIVTPTMKNIGTSTPKLSQERLPHKQVSSAETPETCVLEKSTPSTAAASASSSDSPTALSNVEDLRRQLEMSSARLELANSRLNSLCQTNGVQRALGTSPHRKGLSAKKEIDDCDGLDEILSCSSTGIEVNPFR